MGDGLTCPIFILESAPLLENRADQAVPVFSPGFSSPGFSRFF